MSDIPRGALNRTARLAGLPLSAAGRVTLGWGQRLIGRDRDDISAEMQRRTAEQLFEVLGTLKGGAMKFGQALSVYEAGIPDEYAEPYREALAKLQNSAPAMPPSTVNRLMAEQLGTGWRSRFQKFNDEAAAAASIGQVHRAIWKDGREVAVKIQYPGAAGALKADMDQLSRLGPVLGVLIPGMQVRPLLAEIRDRVMEELDYAAEAANQRAFAKGYDGDPEFLVPKVLASAPKVIVSEWVEGIGLGKIITGGHPGTAGPRRPAARRSALLLTRARRFAARRSASRQLCVDRRRASRRPRFRVHRQTAQRRTADHRAACPGWPWTVAPPRCWPVCEPKASFPMVSSPTRRLCWTT